MAKRPKRKKTKANNRSRGKVKRPSMPTTPSGRTGSTNILRQKVVRPLRTDRKGLSLPQIIKNTPKDPDELNALGVTMVVQKLKKGRVNRKGMKNKAVSSTTRTDFTVTYEYPPHLRMPPPHIHRQLIFAKDESYTGKITRCPEIVLSCTCERHKYKWEFALWRAGAAEVRFGNGAPPDATNPRMIPGACKHINEVFHALRSLRW